MRVRNISKNNRLCVNTYEKTVVHNPSIETVRTHMYSHIAHDHTNTIFECTKAHL